MAFDGDDIANAVDIVFLFRNPWVVLLGLVAVGVLIYFVITDATECSHQTCENNGVPHIIQHECVCVSSPANP